MSYRFVRLELGWSGFPWSRSVLCGGAARPLFRLGPFSVVLLKGAWCDECGDSIINHYMVKEEVWSKVQPARFLHMRCLEARLARQLERADFAEVPINDDIFFAYEMGRPR